MALSELGAIENAYQALESLDESGRRRALRWLSDALNAGQLLPETAIPSEQPAAQPTPTVETAARPAPRKTTATTVAKSARAASTGRSAAGDKATGRPARRSRAGAAQATATVERKYRRMPPADDVLAAYQQTGSVSALAEHFGVPRHTVQGWARRLRKDGYQIGRQR